MLWLKAFHASCAMISLTLFIWRGARMWRQSPVTAVIWRRIVPDTVDTLLLGSGATLAYMLSQYPLQQAWITAKLIAVLAYIMLGFVAFRFGRDLIVRRAAWLAALMIFVYIVTVAYFMRPLPFT